METLLKIFLIFVMVSSIEAQRKLTNIDFLGTGYDVLLGNPRSRTRDPGFKTKKVLSLDYTRQTPSADGIWVIPDHVHLLQELFCSFDVETTEVRIQITVISCNTTIVIIL